jgi:phosphatidate cytidylyltransferase
MIDPMPRDEGTSPWQTGAHNELLKRAASGTVLICLVLAAVWLGGWLYASLIAAVSLVLAWEWGRVVRKAEFDLPFAIMATSLVAAIGLAALGHYAYAFAALGAGTIAVAATRASPFDWLSAAGVPYLGISALSMLWLRNGADGISAVLFVFACVWAHDTAAMLTGRTLRGPRLWPQISPQKTWAGAIGGLAASVLVGGLTSLILPGTSFVWLAGLGLIIGVAAFLGDLAESALKRLGGLKNASSLIPGHGGFLDRLDGAILSFTLAAMIALLINAGEPGRGLIFGH